MNWIFMTSGWLLVLCLYKEDYLQVVFWGPAKQSATKGSLCPSSVCFFFKCVILITLLFQEVGRLGR